MTSMITSLSVNPELGHAVFSLPAMADLIESTKAVAMYVDEEADIFLLCKHPVTGAVDYWAASELLSPTTDPVASKVTPIHRAPSTQQ